MAPRVEVPEIISAEKRCFRVLTFLSADLENMRNISADQFCIGADELIFSEPALFKTEKFSAVSERISSESVLFSANSWVWKFSFSALFRDFQVMNSAKTGLKLFWIRADQRWMSPRRQLRMFVFFLLVRIKWEILWNPVSENCNLQWRNVGETRTKLLNHSPWQYLPKLLSGFAGGRSWSLIGL